MSFPYDRVKNVAAFSFQHAPLGKWIFTTIPQSSIMVLICLLEVLEQSSIAWPNAAMWRQVSLAGPYLAQQQSPQAVQNVEAHSHSPRRERIGTRVPQPPAPASGAMLPPTAIFPRQQPYDPFTDQVHAAFNGWRQPSADVSMPDYSSSSVHTRANSRQVTDPMSVIGTQDRRFESMGMPDSHFDSLCEALMPSAPVNTPQNEEHSPSGMTLPPKQPRGIKSSCNDVIKGELFANFIKEYFLIKSQNSARYEGGRNLASSDSRCSYSLNYQKPKGKSASITAWCKIKLSD